MLRCRFALVSIVALLASGCVTAFPPATPVVTELADGRRLQAGAAGGGFAHLGIGKPFGGPMAQLHGYYQFRGRTEVDLGVIGAGWLAGNDPAGLYGAVGGAFVRPHIVRRPVMRAALHIEAGAIWAGLLLPMSWKIPHGRLYASAGTRFHPIGGFQVPMSLGYRLDFTDRLSMTFEGGGSIMPGAFAPPYLPSYAVGAVLGFEVRYGKRPASSEAPEGHQRARIGFKERLLRWVLGS